MSTSEYGLFPVTDVIVHTDPAQVHLLLDGELLETTPEHPFYTLERGWVDAGDLWVGAHIRQANGSYGMVQFIAVEREPQVMYNLTVAEAHTFFVGAQRWLVHNSGCPPFNYKDNITNYFEEVLQEFTNGQRNSMPNTVAILRLKDGTIYRDTSGDLLDTPGFLANILKGQHKYRFNCAETNCIKRALDGTDIKKLGQAQQFFEGATITTAQNVGTADNPKLVFHEPCHPSGCGSLLKNLVSNRSNGEVAMTNIHDVFTRIAQAARDQSPVLDLSFCELDQLPEEVCALTHIRTLNLCENNLTTLPSSFGQLIRLERLDLRLNDMTTLPDTFGRLQALRVLDLMANELVTLPEVLRQLSQLQVLDVSANKQLLLPDWLGELSQLRAVKVSQISPQSPLACLGELLQLQYLDLGGDALTDLPDALHQLSQLQYLYLGANQLTTLPPWCADWQALRFVNLSNNPLVALPASFQDLSSLQAFCLTGHPQYEVPNILSMPPQVQAVDLSFNDCTVLPTWLLDLPSLQTLVLRHSYLTELPDALRQFTHLQTLNLGMNALTTLPEWVRELPLHQLSLDSNSVQLPVWMGELHTLQTLDLGHLMLNEVPPWIAQLPQLQELNLHGNLLQTFPRWLGTLPQLRRLHIGENDWVEAPEWVTQMPHLIVSGLDEDDERGLSTGERKLIMAEWCHVEPESLIDTPLPSPGDK